MADHELIPDLPDICFEANTASSDSIGERLGFPIIVMRVAWYRNWVVRPRVTSDVKTACLYFRIIRPDHGCGSKDSSKHQGY